jgi:hypothetical protein
MPETKDPFYVGYLPLPTTLRPFVRALVGACVLGAVALALVIAPRQQDVGSGKWDTSMVFAIEGHLSATPYPIVFVDDPRSTAGARAVLLVSSMKFGALKRTEDLNGTRVRAKGHFITRRGRGVFELTDGDDAVTVLDEQSTAPPIEQLGEHTLTGEITDAKCYLGVMKPGFGKTHRACAVRCISGGIPPLFITRDDTGKATAYVLADGNCGPINEDVLPYVSEPVALHGRLERHGDLLVFAIDPASIVRR